MICRYCNQLFMGENCLIKCKIDGHVVTGSPFISKEPCYDCPVEPKEKSNKSLEPTSKNAGGSA